MFSSSLEENGEMREGGEERGRGRGERGKGERREEGRGRGQKREGERRELRREAVMPRFARQPSQPSN